MSKKHVQFYLVGKKLLASVIELHKWRTVQSGPMFPFQYQIRVFAKKWSLFFKPELPPAVLVFFIFSTLPSCCLFFKQWPMEFLKWSLLLGSLFSCSVHWCSSLSLCWCLSPGSLGVSGLLLESWELCPSYTTCIWMQVSSSNTSRSLPGNRDEFSWIMWTIP